MDMPKPTADHKRLEKLAGIWRGTETMYPSPWDPNGGKAQGETRSRIALGGFAVVCDYKQSRDGKVTFEGHGVYAWDAKASQVVLHWFDMMGQGAEVFRGNWKADVLTVQSQGPMGHARLTYDFTKAGELKSQMEMSPDGSKWNKLFDATYQRAD
jgi:Protein of unknown function (DUF1579)